MGDRVWSLGWEDLLEKEMATHSSILALRIPQMEEHGRQQSMGSQRGRLDWATSVQFSHSIVSNSATQWTAARQASLSITHSQSPPKPMWIESVMPSYPLSSPSPPALDLSQYQGLFKWVSSSHQVAKVLEFQLQHGSSNEHPGLISFRMDWLDLLAVQGTLKSLLQHHSSKASILRRSALFIVQLSHPYMTTGKTIALIRWTFVDKVMSLFFNRLFRLVITFLPRSKRFLISWL